MTEPLLGWDAIVDDERRVVAEQLAGRSAAYPDLVVSTVVERTHPSRALLDRARGARLLVVGSRGRGGFIGLLLGSVGRAMVHRAPCPVAVVPPPGDGSRRRAEAGPRSPHGDPSRVPARAPGPGSPAAARGAPSPHSGRSTLPTRVRTRPR